MKSHAVLSALGRDRVGVADDLAAALAKRKINIEDSRMTALQGQFALIAQLSGDRTDLTNLHHDVAALGARLGFHIQLDPIESKRPSEAEPQFLIESFSAGAAGLSAVTGLLKRHRINIVDLETDASASPWTSRLTFHMKARISMPPSFSVEQLKKELRELEHVQNVDIEIRPLPSLVGA